MVFLPSCITQAPLHSLPAACSLCSFFELIEAITQHPVELQQHWWLRRSMIRHAHLISPFCFKKSCSMLCELLEDEGITPERGIYTVYVRKMKPTELSLSLRASSSPHLLFVRHLSQCEGARAWQLQYSGSLMVPIEGLRGVDVLAAAREAAGAEDTAAVLLEVQAANVPSSISWVDISHSSMWALKQVSGASTPHCLDMMSSLTACRGTQLAWSYSTCQRVSFWSSATQCRASPHRRTCIYCCKQLPIP